MNHKKAPTSPANTFWSLDDVPRSRRNKKVTRTLPTSTMNMTGLRARVRGLSFLKLSRMARRMIFGSKIDCDCFGAMPCL